MAHTAQVLRVLCPPFGRCHGSLSRTVGDSFQSIADAREFLHQRIHPSGPVKHYHVVAVEVQNSPNREADRRGRAGHDNVPIRNRDGSMKDCEDVFREHPSLPAGMNSRNSLL
jgi:hypothetical protein